MFYWFSLSSISATKQDKEESTGGDRLLNKNIGRIKHNINGYVRYVSFRVRVRGLLLKMSWLATSVNARPRVLVLNRSSPASQIISKFEKVCHPPKGRELSPAVYLRHHILLASSALFATHASVQYLFGFRFV
jgi:hypothetical protein